MRLHRLLALAAALGLACGQDTAHPKWALGRWKSTDHVGSSFTFAREGAGYVVLNEDGHADSSALMWQMDYPAPDSAVLCVEGEHDIHAACTPLLVLRDTLFMMEDTLWTTLIREGASIQPSHDARRYGCARCTTEPRLGPELVRQAYMQSMKSDLRNLVVFEEAYFAGHVRYTADPSGFVATNGVSRPEIRLSRDGYSATVTHERLPGVVCAIFVGATPRAPATVEGAPACASLSPAERAADSADGAAHARARAAEAERARRAAEAIQLCVSKVRGVIDPAYVDMLRSVCTNNPDAWREWVTP